MPSCDLVGYWPMNGTANDFSGHELHGSVVGGVTSTADRFDNNNNAYFWDGGQSYISVSDNSLLEFTASFTWCLWAYLAESPSREYIIATKHSAGVDSDGSWDWAVNDQKKVSVWTCPAGCTFTALSSAAMPANVWTHLCFVYDKPTNNWKFYKNGAVDLTGTGGIGILDTNKPLVFGFEPGKFVSWKGALDDIRFYSRSLLASDISLLFYESI